MNASDVLNRLTHHKRSQAGLIRQFEQIERRIGSLGEASPNISQRMRACGLWLHLREYLHTGESRLRNAMFCRQFLTCTCCAARRASKLIASYTEKIDLLQGRLVPAMVTLSIANRPDLPDALTHLKASWKRMMEARRKGLSISGRHDRIEWCKVIGAVRAIEVTRNKETRDWHPHAHAFVLLEDYIDQKALSREWERFTGDSFIVDVRKCKKGTVSGLTEVLKYVSKPSELDPQSLLELVHAAKGSRFVDAFGILRGVAEPDITFDDASGLEGPFRDFVAIWSKFTRSYTLKTEKEESQLEQFPVDESLLEGLPY